MPFGFRRTLASILVALAVFAANTATVAEAAVSHRKPKSAKHLKKHPKKKAKAAKKKKKKAKKHHRKKPARTRKRVLRPRRLAPNVVHRAPPALPKTENAYSGSPLDAAPAAPTHEAIPLHDPSAPEEERRVRLDMTKPYGRATPTPAPGAMRGLASESAVPPSEPAPAPSP